MRRSSLSLAAGLGLAALLYFWLGYGLTLEWTDEGHLTYASWRVSQGDLPHRDWPHLYPPLLFVWQGALLHWLGTDLAILRGALMAAKVCIVLLTFFLARRIAGAAAAGLSTVALIVIWGTPVWIFETPYPNHYATLCTLAALAVVLAGRGATRAAFAAGLALGLASGFKQTTGVLAYCGLLFFFHYERPQRTPAARLSDGTVRLSRWLRTGFIAGGALFATAYVLRTPHAWTTAVLLTPVLALAALLGWRERKRPPSAAQVEASLVQALSSAAGLLVAPAMIALWYWRAGALAALARDTISELPQKFSWFTPFPVLGLTPLSVAAACAAVWLAISARRPALRRAAGIAAIVIGAGLIATAGDSPTPWLAWLAIAGTLLATLPVILVWCAMPAAFRPDATAPAHRAPLDQRALALVLCSAAWSLLLLQPAADPWHVFMILPVFIALLAFHLDPLLQPSPSVPTRWRAASAAAAVAIVAALIAPFVHKLFEVRADRLADPVPVPRASGITAAGPDVAALIAFLGDPERVDRPIFVVSHRLLYFLADRRSLFEPEDFTFYMVEADLIQPDVAAGSIDEAQVVDRLRQRRPLVVDSTAGPYTRRLKRVYPELGALLERDSRPVAQFGTFEVRDWGTATSGGPEPRP